MPTDTLLYLFYKDEDITEFLKDDRVIPIRLFPQTPFFESYGFKLLPVEEIPDSVKYIGFLTPSFFKKTGLQLSDIKPVTTVTGFYSCGLNANSFLALARYSHGNTFLSLWDWMFSILDIKSSSVNYHYKPAFYSNLWIAPREFAIPYIKMARQVIDAMKEAPPEIHALLWSNTRYKGAISPDRLMEYFGVPHYPFHAFLLERLVIAMADLWTRGAAPDLFRV